MQANYVIPTRGPMHLHQASYLNKLIFLINYGELQIHRPTVIMTSASHTSDQRVTPATSGSDQRTSENHHHDQFDQRNTPWRPALPIQIDGVTSGGTGSSGRNCNMMRWPSWDDFHVLGRMVLDQTPRWRSVHIIMFHAHREAQNPACHILSIGSLSPIAHGFNNIENMFGSVGSKKGGPQSKSHGLETHASQMRSIVDKVHVSTFLVKVFGNLSCIISKILETQGQAMRHKQKVLMVVGSLRIEAVPHILSGRWQEAVVWHIRSAQKAGPCHVRRHIRVCWRIVAHILCNVIIVAQLTVGSVDGFSSIDPWRRKWIDPLASGHACFVPKPTRGW